MSNCLLIIPIGLSAGSASFSGGLVYLADQRGLKADLFIPVLQNKGALRFTKTKPAMDVAELQYYMAHNKLSSALEKIITSYEEQKNETQLFVVLGLITNEQLPYTKMINQEIATALDAKILFVMADNDPDYEKMNTLLEITAETYGGIRSKRIMGCVINKTGAPYDNYGNIRPEMFAKNKRTVLDGDTLKKKFPIFKNSLFQLFGIIPWNQKLIAPRTIDLQQTLPVSWVNRGEAEIRHIEHISIGMPNIANFDPLLYRFTLIVTVADRENMVLAAAMAEMNNIPLAGLLLTGGIEPSKSIMRLITPALNKGLPVMKTALDTYPCAIRLPHLYYHIHEQDVLRYNEILKHIAEHLDTKKFDQLFNVTYERRISPAAFCYNLIKKAKVLNKTIVLPEGDEPRTLTAAIDCVNKKIARCLLLADAEVVSSLAKAQGLEIPDELQIINPVDIRDNYIDSLVKLRERKGMNAVRAKQLLEDNTVLGTMMLQQGDVDGLVSGALNTTANTILPALQLIKTRPSASLVSSVFFMCLPDQVLVYGDCAINPDPSAEELADIAIQSAESAVAFGIPARVAMISYSTGSSGRGSDVDKVIRATAIVKQQRPDLLIDGPLQYDAAANAEVASKKAPDSPVAGRATVFVFPDLNTGNTTYKAVQRSANVISIGPMLQGLKKPVNDLSRGALVNDIFYTIALTAIQSDQIT